MKLNRLSAEAIRSTESVQRVTSMTETELKLVLGGGFLDGIGSLGFCIGCETGPSTMCTIYINFDCFTE